MANTADRMREDLLAKLLDSFLDPITECPASNEVQLSALLSLFHQARRINWGKVPLWLPANIPAGKTADGLFERTSVCSEYPLFYRSKAEQDIWGSMLVDLLFLSEDSQSLVVIENKIGSPFTGLKGDPISGQLAKQVSFLTNCKVPKQRYLVLLSGREFFERGWYCHEMENTLSNQSPSALVTGFLMRWEDVHQALRPL